MFLKHYTWHHKHSNKVLKKHFLKYQRKLFYNIYWLCLKNVLKMSQENISNWEINRFIKSIIVMFSQRFMNIRLKCFYALYFNIAKTFKKKNMRSKHWLKYHWSNTFPIIINLINFLKNIIKLHQISKNNQVFLYHF